MPTLIPEDPTRCDVRCWTATGPRCECVCNGANHGVGLERALERLEFSGLPDVQLSLPLSYGGDDDALRRDGPE